MSASPQRIRALIADDSPFAVRSIRSCLQAEPAVQVVGTASNGAEALKMIEELQPDLVLLDLQMPRMNGLQVASWLAAEFPTIRVVIVTGIDVSYLAARLTELGVHSIIAKQDLTEQLPALVHKILNAPSS
ncbi:MAG TPA: response regulator [Terriglobales bacterium]|nr:response regulator [Terriglobales bacterium]